MYKLLIVDDEQMIRKGILKLVDFSKLGIEEIYEASNGTEGLSMFIRHAPQLVLLDINLPLMNGLDLARAIKERAPHTKIAMLTGYDYVDYAINAIKIGVDDYTLKPVGKQDVTDIITRLIERYQADMVKEEVEHIVESFKDTQEETSNKQRIKELIESSLADKELSLTSVAQTLGYTPNYLSTLFKNLFGIPFQDYILAQRLEKAKLLLLTTNLKNYEVAERVGFEDVNYFGTRFKRKYGVSPKQYVSQVRQPDEED